MPLTANRCELVARHLFGQLAGRIPQLAFVELRDETFGVTTRYSAADRDF
ncbi:hypothetical protein Q0Z83_050100 [Actinoplanes sichuanensis]|nr:hypothetical protein Q0Z83_050100 [Actinoplanes sichuanensis]